MSWMVAVRGLVSARWFPYVVIAWLVSLLAVGGWGMNVGYAASESNYQEQLSKTLSHQLRRERKQSEFEMDLAIRSEREKHEVQRRINQVRRPVVSCDQPPECVQWYDAVLQAAESDIERVD